MAADERLVFIDASAWVAITNRKDRNHRLAVVIFHRLLGSSTRLVATNWTIYEALTIVKSRLGITQARKPSGSGTGSAQDRWSMLFGLMSPLNGPR